MKKKILMKHILAALTMAAMVPIGQAWAEDPEYTIEEDTITITTSKTVSAPPSLQDNPEGGKIYKDSQGNLHRLDEFGTVEIHFNSDEDTTRALGVYSARYDLPDTNVIVYVNGKGENNDALHLTNWNPHFEANSFTAYVNSPISDAINLSHDATSSYATINDLKAEVYQGNGIRANASKYENNTNTITINKTADITIGGDGNTAVWAGDSQRYFKFFVTIGQETLGKGEVYLNGDTIITLKGKDNHGIWAGKNGNIWVSNVNITSAQDNSYGIAATNENIIYGKALDLSANRFGSIVTLNGDTNVITMNGNNSYALYAEGVDADGKSNTVQSGKDGIGSFKITGDIAAENGGLIDLHATGAESYLTGDVKAYGTENGSGATVKLSVDQALAGMGTIAAANGGTVTLSLGTGSSWSGRADDYQDAVNEEWNGTHESNFENPFSGNITSNGTVNVTLADGAVWNVTGQSWVTNLEGNNSTIMLCGDALHEGDGIVSDGTGGYALHVENLTGTNTFIMNVRPNETGDMLYVKNGNSNTQNLIINNRDEVLTHMNVNEAVRFATVANPGGGFESGSISDGSAAATFGRQTRINDEGMFNVDFAIKYSNYGEELTDDGLKDLGNEESYNGSQATADKPSSDYVENVYHEDGAQNVYLVRRANTLSNLSDAGQTVIDMSKVNYSNAVYMDRLNKRMGEARYIDGDDGLWVRLRHDRIGKEDAFRSMNTMMELGYDWKAKGQKDGEHRQGVVFDYMRGTADYTNVMGDGDIRRAGVWLYDTWLGDKGHYTDYVVKYGHLSNDFDIYAPTTLEEINGDYSNDVWSVSAEYGRKKDIGNDWYIEPQAQMQYAYVTSADYTTSQGTKVELDGIDSLIGRAGFRLGRDTSEGNTVYLKADILHEFLGDQSIRAVDKTGVLSTTYENEGTWYDVGFGFSHRMGRDSYMFLDLERSFGNDNADTWQINVGLNWKV